jgi:hypothetical protein
MSPTREAVTQLRPYASALVARLVDLANEMNALASSMEQLLETAENLGVLTVDHAGNWVLDGQTIPDDGKAATELVKLCARDDDEEVAA